MIREFPGMMQEYYVSRTREILRQRAERIKAVRSEDDAVKYRARVRRLIRKCFGRMPSKTPLRPRTVKTSDFGEYRLEHVIYESRPGFYVTCNLYLPQSAKDGEPAPGVLFTCGHSAEGKAYSLYSAASIRLVRAGYAVLSYDPINQGERDAYSLLNPDISVGRKSCCKGHNLMGKQLASFGEWFGAWRIWDGIRGIDYMLARPEIDGRSIGVVGQSGGGSLSAYLWASDRRLKMVASSCWATSYLLDIENGMPADNEQYPPGFLAAGLDKIDCFIARAGDPVCLLGQEKDFFDDRGLKQGYRELRRFHGLLGGKRHLCRLSMDKTVHGYTPSQQVVTVDFFNRALGRGKAPHDRKVNAPGEDVLKVTPDCNVDSYGSEPVYTLIKEKAEKTASKRKKPSKSALPTLVKRILKVRRPSARPHHRRLFENKGIREKTGQNIYRFTVESEPGIQCVLRHVCDGKTPFRMDPERKALLYLPNICSQQEIERMPGHRDRDDYWILDVRGTGESAVSSEDVFEFYGYDYMHNGYSLMYGESLLGARVYDVLSAVMLLRSEGAEQVRLAGRGQGAILACLAGALDEEIEKITVTGMPRSILEMTCAPLCMWPAVNFPEGILKYFDLPDICEYLGKRFTGSKPGGPERFGG